jgi:acetate kinase
VNTLKSKVSVAKFGGSLLDAEGKGIPKVLKRIREIKKGDALGPIAVFSAPTGITDELIRIGESCAWLGIELDPDANARKGPRISTAGSRASAWVVPTNEELMIARHTGRLLGLIPARA